jgi:hypothetical protein
MKHINPSAQRKPIGGHHFTDRGQIIHSDTFPNLVKALADFRLANSWELGEPEKEILAYYATIAPWLVLDDGLPTKHVGIPAHIQPLREWLNEVYKAGNVTLCPKTEAKERWAGCEGCKYASEIDWEYSAETQEMERKAALLKGMRVTPLDDSFCRLHKWATSVATYMHKPKFTEANMDRSPEACFVRKLSP